MNSYETLWTFINFRVPQDTNAAQCAARRFIRAVRLLGGQSRLVVFRGHGAGLLCCRLSKAEQTLKPILPDDAELHLIGVTDKQFEKSITAWGKLRKPVSG